MEANIYDFVTAEETAYNTLPVMVTENYEWSMPKHLNTTILYKNSQYLTGKDDDKPFKNIIRPILNLQYRAEGFDLKDIVLYVNDSEKYYMSFLVEKYHEKWAKKNKIDTFIDDLVENYVDFGGSLLKRVKGVRPEVVKLQSIAFCDQTDLLGGPMAFRHFFSPSDLLAMASQGWGNEAKGATATLEDAIILSEEWKKQRQSSDVKSKTPGKYVEVYEVHGYFPDDWLDKESDQANNVNEYSSMAELSTNTDHQELKYSPQMHIVMLSKLPGTLVGGITLFKGPEKDSIFKLLLRDPVYGRALGLGGAEELFEPQVWVNYDVIRMKGMLDQAAKVIYQTWDATFAARNKTTDLENGEILITEKDAPISQINTQPINITVFENAVKDWETHAQQMGAANDAIMGESPASGTPFNLQELVTQEASSLHEYRKGKISTFLAEVYQEWFIPDIIREISQDQEFLADLSLDELQAVADNLVVVETNKMVKERILSGQEIQPQMVQQFGTQVREQFMKGGNKRFLKIMNGEMKNAPIDVEIDIAGKQKDLKGMTDKLTNVFKTIIGNPTVLDDPRAAKIFNQILEYSGLSPIDFYTQPPQTSGNGSNSGPKVSESINFKDLPPDGQVQMAAQADIKIAPPAPQPAVPASKPTLTA